MKLPVVDSFETGNGTVWSYESNGTRHQVVQSIFGKKSTHSSRETWTRFLMIGGPVTWTKVEKDWEHFKHDYR
jgi:hypothetical protein